MEALTIIVAALAVLYIAYVVAEQLYHSRMRKRIEMVIHVNGIRGKSTVTRLISAGLRACGLAVFSKTTGTVPMYRDTKGEEHAIRRLGPANIREQLRMLRLAGRAHADVLVIECMAVNPELQYVCEHRILHSDICVITNVREDHLDEMGETLEDIACSFSNTVPDRGLLILGEGSQRNIFASFAEKTGAEVTVAEPFQGDPMDTFAENIAAALAVCDAMGLDRETFLCGMRGYVRDPGAYFEARLGDAVFINAFSANDPESVLALYGRASEKYPAEETYVLLNSRGDRAFRVRQHLEMLEKIRLRRVIVMGSNSAYILSELKKRGIPAERYRGIASLPASGVLFGCGNIAKDGMKVLSYFRENGEVLHG